MWAEIICCLSGDSVDGSEIRLTTWDGAKTLFSNGINYQPQLVRRISSTNSFTQKTHAMKTYLANG